MELESKIKNSRLEVEKNNKRHESEINSLKNRVKIKIKIE